MEIRKERHEIGTMPRVSLGSTGLCLSRLGIGCSQLNRLCQQEAVELLIGAMKGGVTFLDVGRSYGNAEKWVGAALREWHGEVVVASKSLAADGETMTRDIQLSLEYLGLERIDLYQMHGVDTLVDLKSRFDSGVYDSLKRAIQSGRIGHIGISTHSEFVARYVLKECRFESLMFPLNIGLLERHSPVFDYARAMGVGTIAMKPLAGGLLMPPTPLLRQARPSKAISALLALESVDCVIPGVESLTQVEANIRAARSRVVITKQQIIELDRRARSLLGDLYCRGCKYCCPCDAHGWAFDFPAILRALAVLEIYGEHLVAREMYAQVAMDAESCKDCGACASRCPFGLPVADLLRRAGELLGPIRGRGVPLERP